MATISVPAQAGFAQGISAHANAGGGYSLIFARPSYQDGVQGIGAHRGVPDVATDAGDSTGLALINSYPSGPIMATAAGTSAGAPFWAGLVALADQYAGRDLGPVTLPFTALSTAPTTTPLSMTS